MRPHLLRILRMSLLLAAVPAAFATCGTDYWQGGFSYSWDFGPNWSLGYAPQTCDAVIIPDPIHGDGNPAEIYSGSNYTIDSLQIGAQSVTGFLTVDAGGQLHITGDLSVGTAGSLSSNGLLEVDGTATLDSHIDIFGQYLFHQNVYNSGFFSGSGVVDGDFYNRIDGSLGPHAAVNLVINGTLHNQGSVDPPSGVITTPTLDNSGDVYLVFHEGGDMVVGSGSAHGSGTYAQFANGTLDEHISSLQGFGMVQAYRVSLDGTIDIVLDNGFTPSVGSTFDIVDGYISLDGHFANVENQYFNHGTEMWELIYSSNSLVLEAVPAATPEPSSLFLVGGGLAGLGALGRRSRTRLG